MHIVLFSDLKSLSRDITEELWCDEITIFKCQWFVAEMQVEVTNTEKLKTID